MFTFTRVAALQMLLVLGCVGMCVNSANGGFPFHTFDAGNQGWLLAGASSDYIAPTVIGASALWDSRGNPGGALAVGDSFYSTWISAPSAFLGDQSDMYQKSFRYDIQIRYTDANMVDYPTAAIVGNGITLLYTIPAPPLFTWQTRTVTFDESLWRVNSSLSGPVATPAEMQSVLSNVSQLFLLTEWRTGPDDTSIDNVGALPTAQLPGDYNENHIVDAADYTVWRNHLGQSYSLPGENPVAATPGQVDDEDYSFWKAHFGDAAGSGSAGASPSQAAVPEPAALLLTFSAVLSAAAVAASRASRRLGNNGTCQPSVGTSPFS